MLTYLAHKEDFERVQFTVLYKAMLLDRTEQAEVSSFNDLLKTLHNFYKAEEPDSEDKLIKEMENFEEMFGDTEIKFEQDSNKKLSETFAGDLKSLIKG